MIPSMKKVGTPLKIFHRHRGICELSSWDPFIFFRTMTPQASRDAGFLSVGCYCHKNITHGFECLLNKESEHNIFRLIQCRDIMRERLDGIIYDNACNLNSYILNREPRENEYLRTLVDGCHWPNHKNCSQGFNSANYKDSIPKLNSQGREQIHSVIEKLSPSFRNMNYFSYMTMMEVFFGINNLKKKNII